MEYKLPKTIETERLLLVPTTQAHAQEIFKEFDAETTRFMVPRAAEKIEETQAWINSVLKKRVSDEEVQMTILDKTTNEFLGCVGLHDINKQVPELGIRVKKSAHGKKIGREAVAALEARAQTYLDFEYIRYPVDQANIASRKIAESLWGIVEKDVQGEIKVVRVPTMDPTRTLDEVVYRIPKK